MSSLISCTFALTLSPVAMCLEELLPSKHAKSHVYPILIRTALAISTLLVGLSVPFFGRFGDGIDWIFTYNASDSDTALCLLPENLEGKNKPPSGYNMCPYYRNRFLICSYRVLFSSLQYHPEDELNFGNTMAPDVLSLAYIKFLIIKTSQVSISWNRAHSPFSG
ncbi:hypothetical protein RND71_036761 [Anisodus tanguticus]|uniref:Uncharacterized protein n=1 Tax=Anisodus tanguticus TaxID=243964 RepID=A0AAE1R4Q7_9SOLA|nr:hypothetical protein RND71_036761 [Anisodus tanguticus]